MPVLLLLAMVSQSWGQIGPPLQPLEPPPLFRIKAPSLYEAGRAHGKQAAKLIQGYLALPEIVQLRTFIKSTDAGKAAFAQLRADNTASYPQYVQEMEGIASGAGVPVNEIWMINLLQELENLEPNTLLPATNRTGHCTDVMAMPSNTANAPLIHGHNEDWSEVGIMTRACFVLLFISYSFAGCAPVCIFRCIQVPRQRDIKHAACPWQRGFGGGSAPSSSHPKLHLHLRRGVVLPRHDHWQRHHLQ
jgi:hypothetical protein